MIKARTKALVPRADSRPKAIDLFCGAGGMSLGFREAGFNVVGAFDLDDKNVRIHSRNLPETPCWEDDLRALDAGQINRRCKLKKGDLDVVFGGPPCQGFSEIGRNRRRDKRNTLLLTFATLVAELQPRYFVLENVRGLLFGKYASLLARFLSIVQGAGFNVVSPIRLLDASHYGVPQKRRRAFILGHKKTLLAPRYPSGALFSAPTVADAIGDLPDVDKFEELVTSDVYSGRLGVPSAYAAELGRPKLGSVTSPGLSGCQQTLHTATVRNRFRRVKQGASDPRSRCYRLSTAGLARTLRAGSGPEAGSFTAARPIHPLYARYITVREAARLHSFPDWFTFESAKWHALRQIGNSVPPLLAAAVASEILKALAGQDEPNVLLVENSA